MRRLFLTALCFVSFHSALAQEELTKEQIKQFLLTAKVVNSKQTKKGVTLPWRLTLSDGTTTHDGGFQSVDEHKASMQFADGTTEINFVDSYKYNIAAFRLAEMLGVDDIVPVYVERNWKGRSGSLSWWLPVKMDEEERLKKKIPTPNVEAWNRQMWKIRVFDELVYDNDNNLTNVLVSEDWKPWRVDFSRAFRLSKDLRNVNNLERCDRQLLQKLKALTEAEVTQQTKQYLTKSEIQGVMARRDKIVAQFEKLVAQKGEAQILY